MARGDGSGSMPYGCVQTIGTKKYIVIDLRRRFSFEPASVVRTRLVLAPLHLGDDTVTHAVTGSTRIYEALDDTGGILYVHEKAYSKPINALAKDFMNMKLSSMVWRNHNNVLRIL